MAISVLIPCLAYGQADVIKASGGTNLSIDSVATQGFSTLDGPTIRETASGQLEEGQNIVLTLPSGFVWNDNLTGSDITLTVEPTGANNTDLAVSFTSITASEVTLTVDAQSATKGKGKGPGRVDIQGLQLRPSTTDVPTTGQISNTGGTGPNANYGNLSTAVGAISQVRVETAADGSGEIVPNQSLLAGESITVYSIGRDVGDNFVQNVALDNEGDWSIINPTGTLTQTAITPAGDLKSAIFSSQQTGTGQIQAVKSGLTAVPSQTITVLPRATDQMVINTQPASSATAGNAFSTQPVIFLQDQFGNKVTTDDTTQVTASINSGDGSLSGTLTQTASNGEITFSDLNSTTADTITLKFESAGLSSLTSSQIIIGPAAASDLTYTQQPSNTAQNATITPPVKVQLLDEFGNMVKTSGTTVSINDESFFKNSSTLTADTDADGIATFNDLNILNNATTGSVQITSQFSGISSPVASNSFLIIAADQLAQYRITNPSGNNITQQQAGSTFDIRLTARDGNGDIKTDFTGTVEITADADIELNGSQVSSFTTDNFQNGVLDTAITLTSSGSTKIYADAGQSISGASNSFTVTPTDSVDATKSTITANPTSITANGSSTSTITVQLKDEFGNNKVSGGETVELTTSNGTFNGGVTTITANDEGDGTYTAVLTSSTTAGQTATITGAVNTNAITDDATVNFRAGQITTFQITLPQPSTQTAGVPFDIDVDAVDAQGNVVPSFSGDVTFSTNSTISSGANVTFSNGTLQDHTITLTEAAASVTLTATADDLFNVSGTSSSFEVIPNNPDASTSQVSASPVVLRNETNSQSVITVILRDAYQNRIFQQQTVSLNLQQIEEDNNTSPDGNADAILTNGTNIPFNNSQGLYRDTLSATSTIELVEIIGSFGSSPSTAITQSDTIDVVVPNTWTAGAGGPPANRTDWTKPGNWSQGSVPSTEDFVIIPDVTDLPELDLNITVGSFEIQSGAELTLFGGNAIDVSGNTTINGTLNIEDNTEITVGGNYVGSGNFTVGASTSIEIGGDISLSSFLARTTNSQITLNGSSPQTISTQDFLAQNLNIQNDVNTATSNDLIDTSVLTIDSGYTFELTTGVSDTLDVRNNITGGGTLQINDNTLVLGGNTDLGNIDASQGTVVFGVRPGQNPTNFNLAQQQISNLNEMQNAIINNDQGVRTFGDITVDGTLTLENGLLIINSGKSLIAPNQVYNNGSLRIRRGISSQPGWRMISSPINTDFTDLFNELTVQGITGSTYPTRQPNILYYNETIPGTDNQRWRAPSSMSSSIQDPDSTGRGFFFYVFGDVSGDSDYNDTIPVTLNVNGQEYQHQNSTFNFTSVTYTAEADTGWNLVGNPWAASLDWDDAGWTKTNIDDVIYIWDPVNNDYLYWNGIDGMETGSDSLENGKIKPFQAFWVKANAANPVLSVDRSAKTTGGTYYGKSGKNPASIGFLLEARGQSKSMHITLSPDGSNSKDRRDAFRLLPFDTQTYLELYTTLDDGTQLAINNLARSFGNEISIPLHVGGFEDGNPLEGEYTLSWPDFGNVPDSWALTLKDKKTGEEIDLRKNTFYSFDLSQSKQKTAVKNTIDNFRLVEKPITKAKANTGSANNRFVLRIKPGADAAGIPDEYSLDTIYPNPFSDQATIEFATPVEGEVKIMIYDILGRKVKTLVDERRTAAFHKDLIWTPTRLASGIYIVVMQAGGKQLTKKLTYIK